jgi:Tfp pilus assembly protein PilZ
MTKCPKCSHECQPDDIECSQCGTDLVYIKEKIAKEKAEIAEREKEKKRAIARLVDLIKKMNDSQIQSLIEYAEELHSKKKRIHERISCLITADCVHQSHASNNYIKDISFGGVFIETGESLSEGDEITMTLSLSHHVKPFKITGEVVRTSPEGVGVEFKTESQVQEDLIQNMVSKVEELKK